MTGYATDIGISIDIDTSQLQQKIKSSLTKGDFKIDVSPSLEKIKKLKLQATITNKKSLQNSIAIPAQKAVKNLKITLDTTAAKKQFKELQKNFAKIDLTLNTNKLQQAVRNGVQAGMKTAFENININGLFGGATKELKDYEKTLQTVLNKLHQIEKEQKRVGNVGFSSAHEGALATKEENQALIDKLNTEKEINGTRNRRTKLRSKAAVPFPLDNEYSVFKDNTMLFNPFGSENVANAAKMGHLTTNDFIKNLTDYVNKGGALTSSSKDTLATLEKMNFELNDMPNTESSVKVGYMNKNGQAFLRNALITYKDINSEKKTTINLQMGLEQYQKDSLTNEIKELSENKNLTAEAQKRLDRLKEIRRILITTKKDNVSVMNTKIKNLTDINQPNRRLLTDYKTLERESGNANTLLGNIGRNAQLYTSKVQSSNEAHGLSGAKTKNYLDRINSAYIKATHAAKEYNNMQIALNKYGQQNTENLKFRVQQLSKYKRALNEADAELKNVNGEMIAANTGGRGVLQDLSTAFEKFGVWSAVTVVWFKAVQIGKQLVQEVVDLDSAMLELKKVSDMSNETLAKTTDEIFAIGVTVGKTATQVMESAAVFARAGEDIQSSLDLSQVALMMYNVGDGISSVESAATSLLSVIKAFNLETKDASSVVDILNNVSNNAAASFDALTAGIQRMGAVYAQAGNTIEQSVSLFTGVQEILQNEEKAATGLVTINQRLRGITDIGEDGYTGISKLTKAYKRFGIEIIDSSGELRTTYNILHDMATIFPTLTSQQRQYLGELAAGKRQISVLDSLLQNWHGVEKAMTEAEDSAGSAYIENQKYLDSINGRLETLKNTFQDLAQDTISTDLIKGVVSGINTLLTNIKSAGLLNIIKGIVEAVVLIRKALKIRSLQNAKILSKKRISYIETEKKIKLQSISEAEAAELQSIQKVHNAKMSTLAQEKAARQGAAVPNEAVAGGAVATTTNTAKTVGVGAAGMLSSLSTLAVSFLKIYAVIEAVTGVLQFIGKQLQEQSAVKESLSALNDNLEKIEEHSTTISNLQSEMSSKQQELTDLYDNETITDKLQEEINLRNIQIKKLQQQIDLEKAAEAQSKANLQTTFNEQFGGGNLKYTDLGGLLKRGEAPSFFETLLPSGITTGLKKFFQQIYTKETGFSLANGVTGYLEGTQNPYAYTETQEEAIKTMSDYYNDIIERYAQAVNSTDTTNSDNIQAQADAQNAMIEIANYLNSGIDLGEAENLLREELGKLNHSKLINDGIVIAEQQPEITKQEAADRIEALQSTNQELEQEIRSLIAPMQDAISDDNFEALKELNKTRVQITQKLEENKNTIKTLNTTDFTQNEGAIDIGSYFNTLSPSAWQEMLSLADNGELTVAKMSKLITDKYKNDFASLEEDVKSAGKTMDEFFQNAVDYINSPELNNNLWITRITDGMKDLENAQTKLKSFFDVVSDNITDAITAADKMRDKENDLIQEKIDRLKTSNDEAEREIKLEELKRDLEEAKSQKVRVYKEGEGMVYMEDTQKVAEAQRELDNYTAEAARDKQITDLEKQIKINDKLFDAQKESLQNYSKQITEAVKNAQLEATKKDLSEYFGFEIKTATGGNFDLEAQLKALPSLLQQYVKTYLYRDEMQDVLDENENPIDSENRTDFFDVMSDITDILSQRDETSKIDNDVTRDSFNIIEKGQDDNQTALEDTIDITESLRTLIKNGDVSITDAIAASVLGQAKNLEEVNNIKNKFEDTYNLLDSSFEKIMKYFENEQDKDIDKEGNKDDDIDKNIDNPTPYKFTSKDMSVFYKALGEEYQKANDMLDFHGSEGQLLDTFSNRYFANMLNSSIFSDLGYTASENEAGQLKMKILSRLMGKYHNDLTHASIKGIMTDVQKYLNQLFNNIPRNAKGDTNFAGGLTLVGEQGAELAMLPKGSEIVKHSLTSSIVGALQDIPKIKENIINNSKSSSEYNIYNVHRVVVEEGTAEEFISALNNLPNTVKQKKGKY